MLVLSSEHLKQLKELIALECEHINRGFQINTKLGKYYISNAIYSFKCIYLKKVYGDVIPLLSTEYRAFIIGLIMGINDNYKEVALREILIPTVKEINNEELLNFLESNLLLRNN